MGEYSCGNCGAEFNTRVSVQEHMKRCDADAGGDRVYECGKCGATFSTAKACSDHKKKCEGN
jgi:DNA-directed RNA polymerase subunit RPC12/RpoP